MEKLELADCLLALKPKEPIAFPQCQNRTGYGKPSFPKNIDSCPTLTLFWLKMFLTGQTHQYIYDNALVKIDAINMLYDCTGRSVKTWIRCVCSCCSEVLVILSKFRTRGGTRQKKHPSLQRQPRNKKMTEN